MKDYTHITLLVDRSGSMQPVAEESSRSINEFVAEQAKLPGKLTISLYEFDDQFTTVQGLVSAASWDGYDLKPRGWTALLDAMAQAIDDTGRRLRALPADERPERVFFVVVTDGQENASKRFKRQDVSQRVRKQSDEYSWEFVFLGANMDAFAEASSLGVTTSYTYVPNYTSGTYRGLSNAITLSRVGGQSLDTATLTSAIDAETTAQASP